MFLLSLRILFLFAYILNVSVLCADSNDATLYPLQTLGRNPYNLSFVLPLDLDVEFVESVHLNLGVGALIQSTKLQDLGYTADTLRAANVVSDFAFSTPFRLLSDAGVEALQRVLLALKQHSVSCERIPSLTRGGVFMSRFLRGLSMSPKITEVISRAFGVPLLPHTVPHQQSHVNYAPKQVGRAVDLWHQDGVVADYVLFATDTLQLDGGAFEVFRGTPEDAALFKAQNASIPPARVLSFKAPAGYALLLHGRHVVHRAAPLNKPGERITLVNSFVPADPFHTDPTNPASMRAVDREDVVAAEYTVHRAIRARAQLAEILAVADYRKSTESFIAQLELVRDDLNAAIGALAVKKVQEAHFGGAYDDAKNPEPAVAKEEPTFKEL